MKKKWSSFVSIVLALTMLLSSMVTMTAMGETTPAVRNQNRTRLLAALGLEIPSGNANVTRGDFVNYIAKAVNLDELAFDGRLPYQDVLQDAAYYNAVGVFYRLGVLSESDKFNPNTAITAPEAAKIIVSTLGYDYIAQAQGGYPYGYILCAQSLGITISDNTALSGNQLPTLFFEMLEANPNRPLTSNQSIDSTKSDGFLVYHQVSPAKGVITANAVSSIYEDGRKVGEGNISLDGITYGVADGLNDGQRSISAYLGCYINAYVRDENDGNPTVIYFDTEKSNIVSLVSSMVEKDGFVLRTGQEDRFDKYELSTGYSVILNGKLDTVYDDTDFEAIDGNMLLFDHNNDGNYDVVSMENPEYIYTSGVSIAYKSVTDRNKETYGDNNDTILYFDDSNTIYEYFTHTSTSNTAGLQGAALLSKAEFDVKLTACEFADLAGYPTLELIRSRDGSYVRLTAFDYSINASLSEYSYDGDGYVVLNNQQYGITEYAYRHNTSLPLGSRVNAYLTPYGKLIYLQSTVDDMSYGYLMKVDKAGSFDYAAGMLMEDGRKEYLYFRENIKLDGHSYAVDFEDRSNEVYQALYGKPQLLKFSVDSDNKIACIDTATAATSLFELNPDPQNSLRLHTDTTILQKGTVKYTLCLLPSIVPRSVRIFSVPSALNTAPDTYQFNAKDFEIIDVESFPTVNTNVQVFDIGENRDAGAIVMFNENTSSGTLPTMNFDTQKAMVDRIVNSINEDGSPVKMMTYLTMTDNSLGSPTFATGYFTEELQARYNAEGFDIKAGDIVSLTLAGNTITNIEPNFHYDPWGPDPNALKSYSGEGDLKSDLEVDLIHSNNFFGIGKLISLTDSVLSIQLDTPDRESGASVTAYPVWNVNNVVRFNPQKKSFEVISVNDLKTIANSNEENANRVVVRGRYNALMFLVVYPSASEAALYTN
ncbi:MAG: hypothetical protein E7409_07875 [Ruminococcaceae bacterium]|nr:hypothetical protein [Oscillospiraceae bacterium]